VTNRPNSDQLLFDLAEPDQPKKETLRIESPHQTAINPPEPNLRPRETVRVQWPVDVKGGSSSSSSLQPAPEDVSSTDLFSLSNPPAASRPLPASMRPDSVSPPSGPQTETLRTILNPESLRSSPKQAQSLIAQVAQKNLVSSLAAPDKTSMQLYWVVSAFILIIQIWTYFS
jgi:hypothetical protein